MYRTIDDFEKDWAEESESTLQVLRGLTDAALAQQVTPAGRSAGRLAWHIAASIPGMMGTAGVEGVDGPGSTTRCPPAPPRSWRATSARPGRSARRCARSGATRTSPARSPCTE